MFSVVNEQKPFISFHVKFLIALSNVVILGQHKLPLIIGTCRPHLGGQIKNGGPLYRVQILSISNSIPGKRNSQAPGFLLKFFLSSFFLIRMAGGLKVLHSRASTAFQAHTKKRKVVDCLLAETASCSSTLPKCHCSRTRHCSTESPLHLVHYYT